MSLHLPTRQIAQSTRVTVGGKPNLQSRYLLPRTQRRNAWFDWGFGSSEKSPVVKKLTKREREEKMATRMFDRTSGDNIFDEEIKEPKQEDPGQDRQKARDASAAGMSIAYSAMKEHTERALDPDPRWRIRYQRKKVMQMVRANGELTKKDRIKLSEKQLLHKSPNLATSYKKLTKLSHQIVGKTLEDAITQMRYSKKKMAKEIKHQLEEARDLAIVSRGMGLGVPNGEVLKVPKNIQTKDGKWLQVQDPTQIYVDESWVNKGPYVTSRYQFHARGRVSMMWKPSTAIAFVLKEEKTRIRQHEERVEKQAKKKPWVHLPNRPVTAQRPYYCW
ncbi:ribosomal protein L22 [Camillea tinctor]|nr:ribosomal protein L22 [Camillea tinctor]